MRQSPRLCILLSLALLSLAPVALQGELSQTTGLEPGCPFDLATFEPDGLRIALAGWQRQADALEAGRQRLAAATSAPAHSVPPDLGTPAYEATEAEVEAVRREFEAQGLSIPVEHIRMASRFWREGQPDLERAREVLTVSSLLISAAVGAGFELLDYWTRSKLFDEPFTCRGVGRAVVTGATLGTLERVLKLAERLRDLSEGIEHAEDFAIVANYLIPVLENAFGQKIDPRDWANSSLSEFLSFVSSFLGDTAWAAMPCVRAVVGGICDLREITSGNLGVYQTWIEGEVVPCLVSFLGPGILSLSQALESEVMAAGGNPSEVPSAVGNLALRAPGSATTVSFLRAGEIVDWSARVQVAQTGSYTLRLLLFRGDTFKGIAAAGHATASSAGELTFGGSLSTSSLSMMGGGEGGYELRVELSNTTAAWTLVLEDASGEPVRSRFDLRQNRRPTIWMTVVGGQINLLSFDLLIVEPDGTRPASVVLTFNGVEEDLTSRLPATANWAQGYHLTVNKPVPTGIHTARARVTDGVHTGYSGPTTTIRAAGIPYLRFPSVPLTRVGEPAIYLVRVLDALGGIPGAGVYLSSNRPGSLQNENGQAAARVVTGPDGWATFFYTPLATGQHVITVLSDLTSPAAISQTSNHVQPGCSVPEPPRLLSPSDNRDDVGGSLELEWTTPDGVSEYDIHLGTSSPPPFRTSVPAEAGFDQSLTVQGLEQGRQYFWQVKAKAACDQSRIAASPIRTFFTLTAPGGVTLLSPADGATSVPSGLVLDWQNVTTPGATLYSLYFGTSNPPPFHADLHTRTEALLTGLAPNTTYFWKAVARSAEDPSLVSQSTTWRFTTGTTVSTTLTLTAARDAGLRDSSFAHRNYGGQVGGPTEQRLFGLGNWDGLYQDPGAAAIRGVIAFDLSSIPAGSQIQNATLLLMPATFIGSHTQPLPIQIDPLTGSWSEGSITWNNRPSVDTSRRVNAVFPLSGFNPLQLGITDLVRAWLSGEIANHGFQIAISSWEGLSNHAKTFSQRENGAASAPQLQVTYTTPCQAPAAPGTPVPVNGASGVESLLLDWSDVPGAGSYKVYAGMEAPLPLLGLTTSSSFQLPGLVPGSSYSWQVEALAACDAAVASSSPLWTFTTGACLPLAAPAVVAPIDQAGGQARSVHLSWATVAGANGYEVLFDAAHPPLQVVGTTTGSSLAVAGLLPATTYSWRVRALSTCNPAFSAASPVSAFTTALAPRADAGSDRQIASGGTTVLGGSPAASGGTPPYLYNWALLSGSASLSAATAANPELSANAPGRHTAQLIVTDALGFVSSPSRVTVEVTPQGLDFYDVPPCRVLDTRQTAALSSEVAGLWAIAGTCDIPRTARAIAGNLTVVASTAVGYITIFPGDTPPPVTSTVNFAAGQLRSNNLIVQLSEDGAGTIGLRPWVAGSGSVHVILDVSGYFE